MEICCEIDKMVRHPDFRERFNAHQPPGDLVDALRAIERETTIAIIFGFWCPESNWIVPHTLKAISEADNDKLEVLAASVPLDETYDLPIHVGTIAVRRFPTIAFLKGHFVRTEDIPEDAELVRFVEEIPDPARLNV